MSTLDEKLSALSPEKRKLIELRLKKQAQNKKALASSAQGPDQQDTSDVRIKASDLPREQLPLSFSQQRFWFIEQLAPGKSVYNVPSAIHLHGELDRDGLKWAIDTIVQRHEVLRTNFVTRGGQAALEIQQNVDVNIEEIDLSTLPYDQAQNRLKKMTLVESQRAFALADEPLIRLKLFTLNSLTSVLFFNIHHIIFDGWSTGVLIREFAQLYDAYVKQSDAQALKTLLHELPIQYADYAAWQREYLSGEHLKAQLNFWKKYLQGAPALLELPTDHPRPRIQSFRGGRVTFNLSAQQTQALNQLSQSNSCTLFMTLLSGFFTLLHRYCGQNDICIGTPVAGRGHTEIENLMGAFINSVVLRSQIEGSESFQDILQNIKASSVDAFAHQEIPFEKLVDELQTERKLEYSPIFQVMFVLQNVPQQKLKLSGLEIDIMEIEQTTAKFDLALVLTEENNALNGYFEYSKDLFEVATIESMIEHFIYFLDNLVQKPNDDITKLSMLSESDLQTLLHSGPDNTAHEVKQSIIEIFAEQVRDYPDRTALVADGKKYSYTEIDKKSNQLANYLRKLGAERTHIFAIMEERNAQLITDILAVAKIGACYLPIDSSTPAERVKYILSDSRANFLLSADSIVKQHSFTALQNLQDLSEEIVETSPRNKIMDIDGIPFPNRELVDFGKYSPYIGEACVKNSISIVSSRGCPYRCLYCHLIMSKKFVQRTAENIFDEVLAAVDRGYDTIVFVDDIFNLNRKNSSQFFEMVLQHNLKLRILFPNGLRGDILLPDYVDLMAEAGVIQFALALETASPRIQKLIHKNLKIEKLRESLEYTANKYPHIILDLFAMFGFPTETEEEALSTLDFIKSIKWLHFPALNALKIFPGTELVQLGIDHGITREELIKGADRAYHELPDYLPFSHTFAREYQSQYLQEYFLNEERLTHVIHNQKKVLTLDEITDKYDSYLPGGLEAYPNIREMIFNKNNEEQKTNDDTPLIITPPSSYHKKVGQQGLTAYSKPNIEHYGNTDKVSIGKNEYLQHDQGKLRVLLLDLSQHFSGESDAIYDVVEPPIGLLYLQSYLEQQPISSRVVGRIKKSRIDFDNFADFKQMLMNFKPDVIGLRTLTYYKKFFHKCVSLIRHWGLKPIVITGGPYGSSDQNSILSDPGIDLCVLGEGELTYVDLMEHILDNDKKLPSEDVLNTIPGLAYRPSKSIEVEQATPQFHLAENIISSTVEVNTALQLHDTGDDNTVREVLLIDHLQEEIAAQPEQLHASLKNLQRFPDEPAYIIYTSGSTGNPKGVAVNHRNIVRLFEVTQSDYKFNELDVWTLFHSPAFDFSVWEMWGALLHGGKLVMVPPETARNPEDFYGLLCKEEVTVLNQTPSAFRQLIAVDQKQTNISNKGSHLALRHVIFGGEALELSSLQPWMNKYGDETPQLTNMYGITETTVHVTYRPMSKEDVDNSAYIHSPIGAPISDLRSYILDEHQCLVPLGVPGELFISGGGVAQGYVNKPAMTAERFLPNPFSHNPGDRLYRTGDRVRRRRDGGLEYLGRVDHQVKIRGFRIELGEIETALSSHSMIEQCVVKAISTNQNLKQLVAYMTGNHDLAINELRHYLSHTLPDYMVPAHFIFLDTLPLTRNGKIDLKALPMPDGARPQRAKDYTAPTTDLENHLCAIWSEALGVNQIGITDSFFELGGDSILSIQLCGKAEKAGIIFTLQDLFKYQDIKSLAEYLGDRSPEEESQSKDYHPFEWLSTAERGMVPEGVIDAYPMTSLQIAMVYHSELKPDQSVYQNQFSARIRAEFNADAMTAALDQLIAEHPILRTSFDLANFKRATQLVHANVATPLHIENLKNRAQSEQNRLIEHDIECEKQRPFDVKQAPLLRVTIHQCSDDEFQFTMSEHHSILDGWSVASLLRGLFDDYLGRVGKTITETEDTAEAKTIAPIQEYIAAEKRSLDNKRSYKFWKNYLEDWQPLSLPKLGTEVNVLTATEVNGTDSAPFLTLNVESEQIERLKHLASRSKIPFKNVLLTAHLKVLSQLSGQQHVSSGVVFNARPEKAGSENTLGLFLNTLPFKLKLTPSSWAELCRKNFEQEQQLFPHRQYPSAAIQQEFTQHGTEATSLFDTVFNFTHFHIYQSLHEHPDLTVLSAKTFEQNDLPLYIDYSLTANEELSGTQKLVVLFKYNPEKMHKHHVEIFRKHLAVVISHMTQNWQKGHTTCTGLTASDTQRQLKEWNLTQRTYQENDRAGVLFDFEQQVKNQCNQAALHTVDETLSYNALNSYANQLAKCLRAHGAHSDRPVGIYCHRNKDLVIAMLASLKCGVAYVPLDPHYPEKRLAYMIQDAGVSHIITHNNAANSLLQYLQSETKAEPNALPDLIDLDHFRKTRDHYTKENVNLSIDPQQLAYIIYTSGSTGQPKGVQISHAAVNNFLCSMAELPGLEAEDHLLAVTSLSFDIAVLELLLPLSLGAQVSLASREETQNAELLAQRLEKAKITHMQATPSTWRMLVESDWQGQSNLTVLTGGEALPLPLARSLKSKTNAVWNLYGPTETTIWSSVCEFDDAALHQEHIQAPSIGGPIANTDMYILDTHLNPLAAGVVGMLYIGGAGLAQGYHQRAAQTAENFVPHPFSEKPGERLYCTGDLARFSNEGSLEYVGRKDQQVKLNGHRIELGEIESALEKLPQVKAAITVVNKAQQAQLVAYIKVDSVVASENTNTRTQRSWEENIRSALADILPSYMQPQWLVQVTQFPLTPNGKVDRKILAARTVVQNHNDSLPAPTEIANSSPLIDLIAQIWCELLGKPVVNMDENFFSLGGNSLLATQLISQLRNVCQIALPLQLVFNNQTVNSLATAINQYQRGESPESTASIFDIAAENQIIIDQAPEQDLALPLSFAQERLWFLNQLAPNSTSYNIPTALRIKGKLSVPALLESFNHIVDRHASLRTTFTIHQNKPVQLISPSLRVPLVFADLSRLPIEMREAQVQEQIVIEARTPFKLAKGPLFRITVLQLGNEEYQCLLTLHHIICDGRSIANLIEELSLLYPSFAATGERGDRILEDIVEAPKLQYYDYAVWQRQEMGEAYKNKEQTFWQKTLAGAPRLLALKTDRPRPQHPSFAGDNLQFQIDTKLFSTAQELSKTQRITPYMLFLSAYQIMLYWESNQQDFCIGSPIANRHHEGIARLIGFFVNTIAVRGQFTPQMTVADLLLKTRENCLAVYAHQDLPFENILQVLGVENSVSYTPFSNVRFGYQQALLREKTLSDLTLIPQEVHTESAKFDLSLRLFEHNDHIDCDFMYNTDLFDVSTVSRLQKRYLQILNVISDNTTRLDVTLEKLQKQIASLPEDINSQHAKRSLSNLRLAKAKVINTPEEMG